MSTAQSFEEPGSLPVCVSEHVCWCGCVCTMQVFVRACVCVCVRACVCVCTMHMCEPACVPACVCDSFLSLLNHVRTYNRVGHMMCLKGFQVQLSIQP